MVETAAKRATDGPQAICSESQAYVQPGTTAQSILGVINPTPQFSSSLLPNLPTPEKPTGRNSLESPATVKIHKLTY